MPSIETGIRDRWAADTVLPTLLPVDRVFTNQAASDPQLPYAVLRRLKTTPTLRTSSRAAIDTTQIEINVWTTDLAAGMTLAERFADRFELASFDLTEGRVLNMRLDDFHHQRADHELWKLTLNYLITTEQTLQETT